jgi:hypothetical protein
MQYHRRRQPEQHSLLLPFSLLSPIYRPLGKQFQNRACFVLWSYMRFRLTVEVDGTRGAHAVIGIFTCEFGFPSTDNLGVIRISLHLR